MECDRTASDETEYEWNVIRQRATRIMSIFIKVQDGGDPDPVALNK